MLFCGVLLGAPLLLTRLTSAPAPSTQVDAGVATAELAARTASPRASRSEASPRPLAFTVEDTETTTTTVTVAPTVTTVKPRPRLVTTTTIRPKPRPTTTTTAPPPRPTHSQTGGASWYSAGATDCAHRTIPLGTLVTVTNLANGRSAVCRVTTRGPFTAGRIVDLSRTVFGKIASTSSGVIDVRIDW